MNQYKHDTYVSNSIASKYVKINQFVEKSLTVKI